MSIYKRYASNVVVESIGSANTVTFQNTGGTANVIITGDLTVTGNASLSGNISGDKLFNGTTSIEIQTPNGNANVTVAGASNVAVFTATGVNITGTTSASGNVTGANVNTAGIVSATGNVNGGNLTISTGNIVLTQTSGATTAQMIQFNDSNAAATAGGNIGTIDWYVSDTTGLGPRTTASLKAVYSDTGGNANVLLQTNGTTRIAVLGATGNVGVANTAPLHTFAVTGTMYGSSTLTAVGNVTGGNIITAGLVTATGNLVSGANVVATGYATITGNITGGNIISLGAISAGAAGILATGNITGGNINSDGNVSATGTIVGDALTIQANATVTGNVVTGNLVTTNSNVTGNSFGTGIGVENIVWQPTTVAFNSTGQANVGVLGFFVQAGRSYKYEAYMPVLPDGSTTTGFSTYFDAGTCYYTVEAQASQLANWEVSTSNVSGVAADTQSMTGTTPRTVRLSGTIYSAGNANVAIQAQTSSSNINIQSGAHLTYTRLS